MKIDVRAVVGVACSSLLLALSGCNDDTASGPSDGSMSLTADHSIARLAAVPQSAIENANDNCDYDSDGNGSPDRNWATEWQSAHPNDWYTCSAAHSQPLNGNLKAYAAWWLWARLGGWEGN